MTPLPPRHPHALPQAQVLPPPAALGRLVRWGSGDHPPPQDAEGMSFPGEGTGIFSTVCLDPSRDPP